MLPEPRRVAVGYAWVRVAAGVAFLVAPGVALGAMSRPGEVTPAARFAGRLLGVRDLLLGAGALASRGDPDQLRRWVLFGALADTGDALVTSMAFRQLRRPVRNGVLAAALGGAATGAHAWYHLD